MDLTLCGAVTMNRPSYAPERPTEQAPPGPSGRELAVFERPGKGRGPDTELRVDLAEYMGYPFINLRVWSRGPDGSWYPTRKGCSIKIREVENLANTLMEGLRLANVEQAQARPRRASPASQARSPARAPRQDRRPPPRQQGRQNDRRQGDLPMATQGEEPPPWNYSFDEFDD